jgi:hypothetical protein
MNYNSLLVPLRHSFKVTRIIQISQQQQKQEENLLF